MINTPSSCCGDSKIRKGTSSHRSFLVRVHPIPSDKKAIKSPSLAYYQTKYVIEKSPQHINLNRSSFGFGVGSYHPTPLFFRMPLRGKSMKYPSETARRHFKTENEALLWMDLRKYPAYIMLNSSLLFFCGGTEKVRGERCERKYKQMYNRTV